MVHNFSKRRDEQWYSDNRAPTLPSMQLDHHQLVQRFGCVTLIDGNEQGKELW